MSPAAKMPFYVKYFFILGSLLLSVYVINQLNFLLNPLIAAFIIAVILKPLCSAMEKFKIPRIFSTLFSGLLLLIILVTLFFLLSNGIETIIYELHTITERLSGWADQIQQWSVSHLGLSPQDQFFDFKNTLTTFFKSSMTFLRITLSTTAGFFSAFLLFATALFFFLYYREFLISFIYQFFNTTSHSQLAHTLTKVEHVIQNYFFGVLIVIFVIATLNSIGLVLLRIEHAFFFGILAAFLSIIPYIGITIGSLLPIIFTLLTKDSFWYAAGVLVLFSLVQFLEGNFLTPKIIGRQVSVNPFAAILSLFVGGMLLGMAGVIFAVPLLAIIKVFCDEIPALHPIGYVIGNPPKRVKK